MSLRSSVVAGRKGVENVLIGVREIPLMLLSFRVLEICRMWGNLFMASLLFRV